MIGGQRLAYNICAMILFDSQTLLMRWPEAYPLFYVKMDSNELKKSSHSYGIRIIRGGIGLGNLLITVG
jgi:hypothetical protein